MKIPKPLVFNLAALAVVAASARRWVSEDALLDFALGWLVCLGVLGAALILRRFPLARPQRGAAVRRPNEPKS